MREALAAAIREYRTTGDLSTLTRLSLESSGINPDRLIDRLTIAN